MFCNPLYTNYPSFTFFECNSSIIFTKFHCIGIEPISTIVIVKNEASWWRLFTQSRPLTPVNKHVFNAHPGKDVFMPFIRIWCVIVIIDILACHPVNRKESALLHAHPRLIHQPHVRIINRTSIETQPSFLWLSCTDPIDQSEYYLLLYKSCNR